MSRAGFPLSVLVLAVLFFAPTQAQALVFSILPFAPNESATLAITGLALIGLARLGSRG